MTITREDLQRAGVFDSLVDRVDLEAVNAVVDKLNELDVIGNAAVLEAKTAPNEMVTEGFRAIADGVDLDADVLMAVAAVAYGGTSPLSSVSILGFVRGFLLAAWLHAEGGMVYKAEAEHD